MGDRYCIDSHKITCHPARIAEWLNAGDDWEKLKKIYPIYVEVSPYGGCNHRCVFCAVDYVGYQNIQWDETRLRIILAEMGSLGIKSVMFGGEGEPLLWKPLPGVLSYCSVQGIDTALTTNMVAMRADYVDELVRNLSWMKISINAGTSESYAKIHRTQEKDFDRALKNIELVIKTKKQNNYDCVVGAQMLLLPENIDEAVTLAKKMKELGVDYVVIKPYSQHLYSETKRYENLTYESMMDLELELKTLEDRGFDVVFRSQTMNLLVGDQDRYQKCYSTPFFWAYVMTDGSLYGCSAYLKQDEFCYGNLNQAGFKELWEGERRKKNVEYVRKQLDIKQCRVNCRMDKVNRYLWELKNPNKHVNFI